VVNVHLADAWRRTCQRGVPHAISDERELLLETGRYGHASMLPDPFFCLNSDNVWLEGPRVSRTVRPGTRRMDALLLVVPHAVRSLSGRAILPRRSARSAGAAPGSPIHLLASNRVAAAARSSAGPFSTMSCGSARSRKGGFYAATPGCVRVGDPRHRADAPPDRLSGRDRTSHSIAAHRAALPMPSRGLVPRCRSRIRPCPLTLLLPSRRACHHYRAFRQAGSGMLLPRMAMVAM
jgi:hypothetical protein